MSFYFHEAPGPPCLLCDSSFPRAPYLRTGCVTQLIMQMAATEDLPQVAVRPYRDQIVNFQKPAVKRVVAWTRPRQEC